MKNTVSLLICLFLLTSFAFGQNNRQDKIKAAKIGMITDELNLTETQAEKFWPVYNAFTEKRKVILQQIRKLNKDSDVQNDKEILLNQDEVLKLKQKELDLEKDYRDDFLKVISVKQYNDMLQAEKKFNQMLLNKLKERKEKN